MENVRAITSAAAGLGLEPFLASDPREASPAVSRRERDQAPAAGGLAADPVEISPEALRGVRRVGSAAGARREEPETGIGLPRPDAGPRPVRSRQSEYNEALGTFQTTVRIGKREYQVPPEQLAKFRESYGRFVRENFSALREPRVSVGVLEPGTGQNVDEEG